MVVCREASLFSDFYQKSPHLLAVRAQSDIIRVTCTSLAVDKTSRVSESLDLNWQPLLDSRESMGYSSSFKGGLLSEAPHRQLVKWLKSRNILSCSQNQSGPGLIESRELIPFSLLPQYRSFSLLDTLSPPHLYPTPSWFSTGRALDSCSSLTCFTAYNGSLTNNDGRRRSGYGVVGYAQGHKVFRQGKVLGEHTEVYDTKMVGLWAAAEEMRRYILNEWTETKPERIIFYANNLAAITKIFEGAHRKVQQHSKAFRRAIGTILCTNTKTKIAISWCPGHSSIIGNCHDQFPWIWKGGPREPDLAQLLGQALRQRM